MPDEPLDGVVLTEGYRLYVKMRRGVYHEVDRLGRKKGVTCTGFEPRPRWRPAKLCSYDINEHGLICPRCGLYDTRYAMTGERSFCMNQMSRQQQKEMDA